MPAGASFFSRIILLASCRASNLDPRQYDPRRIIREALLEPTEQQAKTELLPNHDDYPAARMDPIDFNEPQPVEEAKAVKAVKAVKPIAREDKLAS